jgi:hypothetical protein
MALPSREKPAVFVSRRDSKELLAAMERLDCRPWRRPYPREQSLLDRAAGVTVCG